MIHANYGKTAYCCLYLLAASFIFAGKSLNAQSKAVLVAGDQSIVDGLAINILPGDTLFLETGRRNGILLKNLTGSAEKPVVIINKSGKVVIHSEKDYGIFLDNSVHCKITGTGSSDAYGIEIASSKNHGLVVAEFSTDCEADHLDIHHSAYAGVVAKTDPNCARKDLRFFIMKNLSFHENYIHDTYAEGFYVGYSWYPVRQFQCDKDSLLYPHEIHSVRIYNNILKNTGQEAIQVGTGTKDIKIYGNSIYNYGTNNTRWQNHGVQIGQGTTGEFFYNSIDKGPAEGISLFGGGNNFVYNNTIKNTGSSAIYQNDRGAIKNAIYKIYGNRIAGFVGQAVVLVSDYTSGNEIVNNTIITDNPDSAIADNGKIKWKASGNKIISEDKATPADTAYRVESPFAFLPFEKTGTVEMKTIQTTGDLILPATKPVLATRLYDSKGMLVTGIPVILKGEMASADLHSLDDGIYYLAFTGSAGVPLIRVIKKANRR